MLSQNDQKFDKLARVYDFLVRLVFGASLRRAQCFFLEELPNKGNLLVIGGGSGWILEEISDRRPELHIYYVEASKSMIEKTKKRSCKNSITYIHGNEQMLPADIQFDAIFTAFFLDLFAPIRLLATVSLLDQALDRKGIWLFTDFHVPQKGLPKFFGKFLIFIMYRFFRLLCQIDGRKLPDFDKAFAIANYAPVKSQLFYAGIVRTVTLKKEKQSFS